jgi:hypothetical protein
MDALSVLTRSWKDKVLKGRRQQLTLSVQRARRTGSPFMLTSRTRTCRAAYSSCAYIPGSSQWAACTLGTAWSWPGSCMSTSTQTAVSIGDLPLQTSHMLLNLNLALLHLHMRVVAEGRREAHARHHQMPNHPIQQSTESLTLPWQSYKFLKSPNVHLLLIVSFQNGRYIRIGYTQTRESWKVISDGPLRTMLTTNRIIISHGSTDSLTSSCSPTLHCSS